MGTKLAFVRRKGGEWIQRYLPAEILAVIGALTGALLVNMVFHKPLLTALGGTWGENVGYYGTIITRSLLHRKRKDSRITRRGLMKVVRDLAIEFGPAEYFDSFLIRPATMYFFPRFLGNIPLGILIGKLTADITFYIPAILSYELRKRYIQD